MNPVLGYLINRPGLLAGILPVLLLACIWVVQYWRQRKRIGTSLTEWQTLPLMESDWPTATENLPYYRSSSEEAQAVAKRSAGFLSPIVYWAVDYFITHFALVSVLGAVAFGGIAVTSILSHMKFANAWVILVGVALFLLYLAFVGIVIILVNSVSEQALRRLGRRKQ